MFSRAAIKTIAAFFIYRNRENPILHNIVDHYFFKKKFGLYVYDKKTDSYKMPR